MGKDRGTNASGGGGSNKDRPASQQRGQATGKHIKGDAAKGKDKLDEIIDEWIDDIQSD